MFNSFFRLPPKTIIKLCITGPLSQVTSIYTWLVILKSVWKKMYHSISFGIGLQVFVYSDSLIKCFNEPCAHAPDVRIMIRWPRESPQMIFQWNDFLNALLGFLICVLEKTGTVYICWNKPPGIKQIYWINSQLKIKLTWYQSLYKGSHLYGTFNFFFNYIHTG